MHLAGHDQHAVLRAADWIEVTVATHRPIVAANGLVELNPHPRVAPGVVHSDESDHATNGVPINGHPVAHLEVIFRIWDR